MIKQLPRHRRPLIIFLTAYDEYALNAFEANALDYLLKPIDRQRFAKAIRRARRQLKLKEKALYQSRSGGLIRGAGPAAQGKTHLDRFLVRNGSRLTMILADEIDWIESAGDYAGLHVGEKTRLIRETLKNLERTLDPGRFVRIHRSAIVQISRIRE